MIALLPVCIEEIEGTVGPSPKPKKTKRKNNVQKRQIRGVLGSR